MSESPGEERIFPQWENTKAGSRRTRTLARRLSLRWAWASRGSAGKAALQGTRGDKREGEEGRGGKERYH
jgi:hypothetical protein